MSKRDFDQKSSRSWNLMSESDFLTKKETKVAQKGGPRVPIFPIV